MSNLENKKRDGEGILKKFKCASCGAPMNLEEVNKFKSSNLPYLLEQKLKEVLNSKNGTKMVAPSSTSMLDDMVLCPICSSDFTELPNFNRNLFAFANTFLNLDEILQDNIVEEVLARLINFLKELPYWKNIDVPPQIQDMDALKEEFYVFYRVNSIANKSFLEIKESESLIEEHPDIFISHSWEGPDEELVGPLVAALRKEGYIVWYDKEKGLNPGDLIEYIKGAIINSKNCIPIICRKYFEGFYTRSELEMLYAIKDKKHIIPIWYDDVDTNFLKQKGDLGKQILKNSGIAWTNCNKDFDILIKKLIEMLDTAEDLESYAGIKLFETEVNVLKFIEKEIGFEIPPISDINIELFQKSAEQYSEIKDRLSEYNSGFIYENNHVIGLIINKDLEGNDIVVRIPPILFKKLKYLRILKASLTEVPEELSELGKLIWLDLSNGAISYLPSSLKRLSNLKLFCIENNPINNFDLNDDQFLSFLDKFLSLQDPSYKEFKNINLRDRIILKLLENFIPASSIKYQSKDGKIISLNINARLRSAVDLPEFFGGLENLKELYLQHSGKILPQSFGNLINLEILELNSNSNLESLPESFGNLKNLKGLKISGSSNLLRLPESFGDLENLIYLELTNYRIEELPQSFGNLYNLQSLIIKERLTSLPDSFGKLSNLSTLSIENSMDSFNTLPDSFGGLASLQDLLLKIEHLKELPRSFGNLKSLKKLRFEAYEITELVPSFGSLQNLEDLMLKIHSKHLPESFGKLAKLKKFVIVNKMLEGLLDSFGDLKSLEYLKIKSNGNTFTYMPESFGRLSSLKNLFMYYTQLEKLPESFGNLRSLEFLLILQNRPLILPQNTFEHLTNLEKLYIDECSIEDLPPSITNLVNVKKMSLSLNSIKKLQDIFGNFKKLTYLNLKYNYFKEVPASIGDLQQLTELNLSKNSLEKIPESLGELGNLKQLDLSANRLSSIPLSMKNLKQLQFLYLDKNELKSLSDSFKSWASLKTLSLDSNQFEHIPRFVKELNKLRRLSMKDNPLVIDKENKEIYNILKKKGVSIEIDQSF